MASIPAVRSHPHELSNRNGTVEDAVLAEERAGIGMLMIIIGGILGGALAGAVLVNFLVVNLS